MDRSRKFTNKKQLVRKDTEEPLYYPSVFRYKCRGALLLTTDTPGSSGVCRGLQSRLEHVRDLAGQSTYNEAVAIFEQAAGDNDVGADSEGLVGKEQLKKLVRSQAIVYADSKMTKKKALSPATVSAASVASKQKVSTSGAMEGHPSNLGHWQEWSCYGSTEVNLLVLRDIDSNQERVAGIVPNCKFGVSLRDVGNEEEDAIYTVGSMRLGFLEISLAEVWEDDTAAQSDKHNKNNAANKKTIIQHHQQQQKEQQQQMAKETSDKKKQRQGDESHMTKRLWDASTKVTLKMKDNAILLKDSVSDDFPNRVYNAGGRVINQFPKTIDRTTKLVKDVYKMWTGSDDDDDGF